MVYTAKAPVVYDVSGDDVGSLFTSPVPYSVYARASVGYFTEYSHPWHYRSAGRDATFQQVYQDSRKKITSCQFLARITQGLTGEEPIWF